ncbi:MAG: FtsW/RodA/SpoVE family cell cycle protein [Oscillospiraceae bacterium]
MKAIKRYLHSTDIWYLLLCMICSGLSVLVLVSICQNVLGGVAVGESGFSAIFKGFREAFVQLGASCLGIVCAILLSLVDYRSLVNFWPVHMALTWGLVILTFLRTGPFGKAPLGTDNYSWIMLPGGLSLQPTELAKISFIMTFAMHLDNVHAHINEPKTLLKLLLHIGVPVLVVHFQGDDGTALVFLAIGGMMLFAGGLSIKYILSAVAAGAVAVPVLMLTGRFKGYQLDRILALFNPDEYEKIMYQQNMARVAIGAGRINGRGLFSNDHFYVPLAQNDFIFSYMAEAFGFLGSMAVIGVLFAIAIKTLTTGLRAQDRVGSYICVGVFATLAWQIIINLGMNLTLLPVIGVTLPFFSAGGTSVLMLYLCVGLVLSVYIHNKKTLFDR